MAGTGTHEVEDGREAAATGSELLAFLGEAPERQSDLPAWLLPAALRGERAGRTDEGHAAG